MVLGSLDAPLLQHEKQNAQNYPDFVITHDSLDLPLVKKKTLHQPREQIGNSANYALPYKRYKSSYEANSNEKGQNTTNYLPPTITDQNYEEQISIQYSDRMKTPTKFIEMGARSCETI